MKFSLVAALVVVLAVAHGKTDFPWFQKTGFNIYWADFKDRLQMYKVLDVGYPDFIMTIMWLRAVRKLIKLFF